jgi:hypothetical protein
MVYLPVGAGPRMMGAGATANLTISQGQLIYAAKVTVIDGNKVEVDSYGSTR